jgi:hypothetical protein
MRLTLDTLKAKFPGAVEALDSFNEAINGCEGLTAGQRQMLRIGAQRLMFITAKEILDKTDLIQGLKGLGEMLRRRG